jgi:N-acetylmuramoyl-L-alanine amidase
MTSIVMSSGHGAKIAGAIGPSPWGLDEHKEAVRVVDCVAEKLRARGVTVTTGEDKTSTSQSQNLNTIVAWHNSQPAHDINCSVHFNAYLATAKPMGTECLWKTEETLATKIADAIASVGYVNRGPKKRTDLAFLNGCANSVLIETCFVDSEADAHLYQSTFDETCEAIATALSGQAGVMEPTSEPTEPPATTSEHLFEATGKCSHFGGPLDQTVTPEEGLAFHYELTEANQHLFLPLPPANTSGLARRLNAEAVHYIACRWDYAKTPKQGYGAGDQCRNRDVSDRLLRRLGTERGNKSRGRFESRPDARPRARNR